MTMPTRPGRRRSALPTGIAGLCALALAATTAPATTANASADEKPRTVDLLSAPASARATTTDGERTRGVQVDVPALSDVRTGDRVSLELFDGTTVTAVVDDRTRTADATTWSGGLIGEDGTFIGAEVDGTVHLNVSSVEHGTFEVSSTKGGGYVVSEAGAMPPTGADAVDPATHELVPAHEHGDHDSHGATDGTDGRAPGSSTRELGPARLRDAPGVIDVAIVYPAALATQMTPAAMQAQFELGIAQTNEAFRNSGIPTQVRLVGSRQSATTQSSNLSTNLKGIATPGDGLFDEATALREETHADLVSLWMAGSVPAGASCGMGYLSGINPANDAEWAGWSVVYAAACATEFRVFTHELGHNFSADHNVGAGSPPLAESKPYARGYVDVPARTITVMSYYEQCVAAQVNCTRIGYFSSPNVAAAGRAQGTAATNNVQAITEQIASIASYRQSQIYPGAVSIGGRARFKGKASAATTDWAPAVTLGYQWFLDGTTVPGATGSTFKASRRDIGKTLALRVTGSAPYYAPVSVDTAPVVIGKALFKTKRPKVKGVPRAGRVLSVKVKGWKPKPSKKSVKVRYQWFKNGKKIKGAKKATYRVRGKDRGKKITVRVTVKAKGYDKASRTSKKVKIRR